MWHFSIEASIDLRSFFYIADTCRNYRYISNHSNACSLTSLQYIAHIYLVCVCVCFPFNMVHPVSSRLVASPWHLWSTAFWGWTPSLIYQTERWGRWKRSSEQQGHSGVGQQKREAANCQFIHPGGLILNLQITHLERKMIFQTSMIMFHV